jgi:tripartite-type tricarboxylate transporter receptor subunit TctC
MAAMRSALAVLAAVCAAPVLAQGDFPSRPLRIVVPSAPAGGTDIVARLIAQGLTERLQQSVVVDNRGGAGGIPAVGTVAKSTTPDGYTLMVASNGHLTFGPALYRNLPYDPQKDLAPVMMLASQPFVVATSAALPAATLKEFIALAKAKPGAITYGSGGSGSATHLGTAMLESLAGISLLHVPYKGSGIATTALMTNEIQVLLVGLATVLPQMAAGRLKVLGVTTVKRSPAAPEIPTVAEAGVPGYEFDVWYGMVAPAATPRAVISRLHREVFALMERPALRERFAGAGLEPLRGTPEEFAARMRLELPKWREVVRTANIRAE